MGRDAAGGKPGRLFWQKLNFSVHGGHGADGVEELRRIKRLCADFGVELRFLSGEPSRPERFTGFLFPTNRFTGGPL